MLNRNGLHRTDEIAIADVAMATLGPIALLMMVFLALSTEADDGKDDCPPLSAQQLDADAQTLKAWIGDMRAANGKLDRSLAQVCPSAKADAVTGDLGRSPLDEVCRDHRAAVAAQAGTSVEAVQQLLRERALLEARMANCTPRLACRVPDSAAVATLARGVSDWAMRLGHQLDEAERLADRVCDAPRPATVVDEPVRPPLPTDVCPESVDTVIGASGLSPAAIAGLTARRGQLLATLAACTPRRQDCRSLSADERADKAKALRADQAWAALDIDRLTKATAAGCAHVELRPGQSAEAPFLAASADLCDEDRAAILAAAGETTQSLRESAARRLALLEQAGACLSHQPEMMTKRSVEMKFGGCEISGSDDENDDKFFKKQADFVAESLKDNSLNRIDIFGHADRRPLSDECKKNHHIENNYQLSALRALYYQNRLIGVLRKDPAYADIAQKLRDHALRIYAIAVGDAETNQPGAKAVDDDRRIEVRFTHDIYARAGQ